MSQRFWDREVGFSANHGKSCGMGLGLGMSALLIAGAALTVNGREAARGNLTITPTFGSSISSSAYATTIESDINSAISFYQNSFVNPINVNIYFTTNAAAYGVSGTYVGLNASMPYHDTYTGYTTKLQQNSVNHANNTDASTAYNNLAYGNQPTYVVATSADFRALGYNTVGGELLNNRATPGFGVGYVYDGVILLNASEISGFTSGSGGYSANRSIQHEIDEVLGMGGAGSQLNQSGATINMGPMDLFRYSAPHVPSYTTSGSASSYFSINGGNTDIVSFNQNPSQPTTVGDFGDWGGSTNYVQQAFATPGDGAASVSLTSPEGIALQAIGYNTAVPEPATLGLMTVGGLALLLGGKKRKQPPRDQK